MLQFQEGLSIYKIEFWCGLAIAILIWGYINEDLCFGQKYTLASWLGVLGGGEGGKGVKISKLDWRLE